MGNSIEITRKSDLKKFIFFEAEVPNASWNMSVKRFKFEEPNGDGTGNLAINLGTEKTISFPFKLLKSDSDASGGTNGVDLVQTISEKVDYLIGTKDTDGTTDIIDPFLKTEVNDFYYVDITSHSGSWKNNKVLLDSISFSPSNTNPESLSGRISFTIGGGYQ